MYTSLSWSLREGTSVAPGDLGLLVVRRGGDEVTLGATTPGIAAVLGQLGPPGEREDRLMELARQAGGAESAVILASLIRRLANRGFLARRASQDGTLLATLTPISPSFEFAHELIDPMRSYELSRFAFMRRTSDSLVLESPLSHARIDLHDWHATAVVHAVARPCRIDELTGRIPSLSVDAATGLLTLLFDARMLCALDDDAASPEDASPALRCWEFHDLLFHARSRAGRHDNPTGGTYRFAGRLAPPAVLKASMPGPYVALYRPDLDRLERDDPPFAAVQEARRSIRDYSERPISDRQLGEFLYRVGRVADYHAAEIPTPEGPIRIEHAPRPYPAGGALYELDLYVAINACENVSSGLYAYDAQEHRLDQLSGRTAELEQLLSDAGRSAGIPDQRLQVLIIVGARFQRIAWKYASIAYSLTLKHVGVLYQTMYLAATAMDLAPCALGAGNADLFARAAGTDYYAESSVGEFLLGKETRMIGRSKGPAALLCDRSGSHRGRR